VKRQGLLYSKSGQCHLIRVQIVTTNLGQQLDSFPKV